MWWSGGVVFVFFWPAARLNEKESRSDVRCGRRVATRKERSDVCCGCCNQPKIEATFIRSFI